MNDLRSCPHTALLPGLGPDRAANRSLLRRALLVWVADPAALPDALATPAAWACLSAAEQAWQRSLHFAADRQLYGAAHVLLRHALAACQGTAPQWLGFVTNAYGRPELCSRRVARRHPLRFSLSHSTGLVAVAVTLGCDVGVDVEPARTDLALNELTPGLLSAVDRRWFSALPAAERSSACIGLWTLKESLLKAYGLGIADELGNIALVPSWQQPRAVLVTGRRLTPAVPAGVVLSALDGGDALAVSAFAHLQTATLPPETLQNEPFHTAPLHTAPLLTVPSQTVMLQTAPARTTFAPGTRQVLLFDLRPGRAAPLGRACLPVCDLPVSGAVPAFVPTAASSSNPLPVDCQGAL